MKLWIRQQSVSRPPIMFVGRLKRGGVISYSAACIGCAGLLCAVPYHIWSLPDKVFHAQRQASLISHKAALLAFLLPRQQPH
jgi:hypothetical protein